MPLSVYFLFFYPTVFAHNTYFLSTHSFPYFTKKYDDEEEMKINEDGESTYIYLQ